MSQVVAIEQFVSKASDPTEAKKNNSLKRSKSEIRIIGESGYLMKISLRKTEFLRDKIFFRLLDKCNYASCTPITQGQGTRGKSC